MIKSQHLEAMRRFTFNGLSFGDSEADIEKYFSEWEYDPQVSNPKANIHAYLVFTPGVDTTTLMFFNGQFYCVSLIYYEPKITAMGGWITIPERLVERFGKADSESPGVFPEDEYGQFAQYFWPFQQINRSIALKVFTKFTIVYFTEDNLAAAALDKKKREANLGF